MWRIVVTSLLYIVMVESRPMDPIDGSFWEISIPSAEFYPRRNPDVRTQRSFHQNIYNPDADYDLLAPQFSQKRAITMFSRWNPISSIGKQRTPIRSNNNPLIKPLKERQHGQPLRWG